MEQRAERVHSTSDEQLQLTLGFRPALSIAAALCSSQSTLPRAITNMCCSLFKSQAYHAISIQLSLSIHKEALTESVYSNRGKGYRIRLIALHFNSMTVCKVFRSHSVDTFCFCKHEPAFMSWKSLACSG